MTMDKHLDSFAEIYRNKIREQGKGEYSEEAKNFYKYSVYESVSVEYHTLLDWNLIT